MTNKLKNQSESNKQAQDNLHKQVQEQKSLLRSAQDRAHTLETSVTELTAQLTDSKEKVSQLDAQVSPALQMKTVLEVLRKVKVLVCCPPAESKDRAAAVCRGSQSCTEGQPGEQPGDGSACTAGQAAGWILLGGCFWTLEKTMKLVI